MNRCFRKGPEIAAIEGIGDAFHEQEDLGDAPQFLLTDALHWESGRILETWSYRWASEIFHEFSKQVTGLEAAQVRKEGAVQRHFRLSCVAQSLVQLLAQGRSCAAILETLMPA